MGSASFSQPFWANSMLATASLVVLSAFQCHSKKEKITAFSPIGSAQFVLWTDSDWPPVNPASAWVRECHYAHDLGVSVSFVLSVEPTEFQLQFYNWDGNVKLINWVFAVRVIAGLPSSVPRDIFLFSWCKRSFVDVFKYQYVKSRVNRTYSFLCSKCWSFNFTYHTWTLMVFRKPKVIRIYNLVSPVPSWFLVKGRPISAYCH